MCDNDRWTLITDSKYSFIFPFRYNKEPKKIQSVLTEIFKKEITKKKPEVAKNDPTEMTDEANNQPTGTERCEGENEYKCEKCVKSYVDQKNLIRHQKQMHSENITKYVCRNCPKIYADQWLLKKHLNERHNITVSARDCEQFAERFQNTTSEYLHI